MGLIYEGADDGRQLVRLDNPECAIVGTSERMCICYPIRPERLAEGWGWEYTGGEPREYDETAEQETDADGSPLFQDEDGNDVPAWNVAVRHKNGRLSPLAEKPAKPREALADVVRELLAYEREAFEEDTPMDLADLCTALGAFRVRLKNALGLELRGVERDYPEAAA
jgi:hypothetical protein